MWQFRSSKVYRRFRVDTSAWFWFWGKDLPKLLKIWSEIKLRRSKCLKLQSILSKTTLPILTNRVALKAKMQKCVKRLLSSKVNECNKINSSHSYKTKFKRASHQALPNNHFFRVSLRITTKSRQPNLNKHRCKFPARTKFKAKGRHRCDSTTRVKNHWTYPCKSSHQSKCNLGLLPHFRAIKTTTSLHETLVYTIKLLVLQTWCPRIASLDPYNRSNLRILVLSSHLRCRLSKHKRCQPVDCPLQHLISQASLPTVALTSFIMFQ